MNTLLARHEPSSWVAFGAPGARTARELEACARAISGHLELTPGFKVAVIACTDRYFFAASLLAAWSLGLQVALPENGQPDTVHGLVRKLDAATLLHDRDAQQGLDVRTLEHAVGPSDTRLEVRLTRDDAAVIVFTSGSTGHPEAHEKTLAQLLDEVSVLSQQFELAGKRVLAAVPPYHLYGLLFGVLVPLVAGGAMGRTSPLLPADLLASAKRDRADVLVAVPPHLRSLAQYDDWRGVQFVRVFSSGGPLPDEVADAMARRGSPVTQVFGSTETGGIAFRESSSAVWSPLPFVRVSQNDQEALQVDSAWLAASQSRPMTTHDHVALVEGGFRHLGRLDAVHKVGGRRIDLGDLEVKLREVEGVRDARVLAERGDAARGTTLLAVVEADGLSAKELRRALLSSVDPVVIPRRFRVVSALPRNPLGKVTRAALLSLFDSWTVPRASEADGSVRVEVPGHLGFFRGHFEGQPMLPGVVQLHALALAEVRQRWPELSALSGITRVEFRRPVVPCESLTLRLLRKRPKLVEFSLTCGDELVSSGLLHFRPFTRSGVVHD